MAEKVTLNINGKDHTIEVDDPAMPLLYALRDELGFNNPRFGCGLGQCGACTVLRDGVASRSCQISVTEYPDAKYVTLSGLGTPEKPHPVQTAWIEEQVNQCGYCISGWVLSAAELLKEKPTPDDDDIRIAFAGLICRCGTHNAAVRAVKRASGQL